MNVALAFFWASSAWAGDIPERPTPPAPISGECLETVGIDVGDDPPGAFGFGGDAGAACSAVLVPLSVYQDFLQTEIWAEEIDALYRIEVSQLAFERDWFRDELLRSEEPEPFWSRPGVMMGVGVLSGVAIILASAYSLEHVSGAAQ